MKLSDAELYAFLCSMDDTLEQIYFILNRMEQKLDKEIKSAKKVLDKKMDKLVRDDIKRDKKCEHAEKMAKKKK